MDFDRIKRKIYWWARRNIAVKIATGLGLALVVFIVLYMESVRPVDVHATIQIDIDDLQIERLCDRYAEEEKEEADNSQKDREGQTGD